MTTITYPSLAEMEAWLTEESTHDPEPCDGEDCDLEAVAALLSNCGTRTPLCLIHSETLSEWLTRNYNRPYTCGEWSGPMGEHMHFVPL